MKNFYNDRVKKRIQMSLLMQAIIMNFFVFLVSQIFFEPEFETNDDNYISSILYGVYGNYDTHLVYMNVFCRKNYKTIFSDLSQIAVVYDYTIWIFMHGFYITNIYCFERKRGKSWIFLMLGYADFFWV